MRVLLDEHLPVGLASLLQGHDVHTVAGRRWQGIKNGELLDRMRGLLVPRLESLMPYISKTPQPPYYAVVFTSINADVDHTEHTAMFHRLLERAASHPGYLGIEPARNSDGSGVAVVYFADAESITAWARDPEHRVAKQRGREEWYSHYMIRICRVEREYGRPDR